MQTQYIDNSAALDTLCQSLRSAKWLALDTEFIREKTYYSQLCLVQISDGEHIFLVDTIAIGQLEPLCELLESPLIEKVFHSASQDLEIFYNLRLRVPTPLFDTQIAAALLGQPGQISYAAMVEKYCSVQLDKSHSRTDWSRRPLSEAQLAYAAADVDYLAKIYLLQRKALEERGRLTWHSELCDNLCALSNYANPPEQAWARLKGHARMQSQQLVVLHALAAWRELRAQQTDEPRRWVLADERLMAMAEKQPADTGSLTECGLSESQIRRFGGALIDIITTSLNTPEAQWPQPTEQYVPSSAEKKLTRKLIQAVQAIATEHEIDPAYLARRKDIESLVRGDRNLLLLEGWRRQLAGEKLLQLLASDNP
jgi:ribonuclease D